MLVKCAADELGEHNIRVNAVQPGIVDTDLMSFITAGGPILDSYYENMPVVAHRNRRRHRRRGALSRRPRVDVGDRADARDRRRPPTPVRPRLRLRAWAAEQWTSKRPKKRQAFRVEVRAWLDAHARAAQGGRAVGPLVHARRRRSRRRRQARRRVQGMAARRLRRRLGRDHVAGRGRRARRSGLAGADLQRGAVALQRRDRRVRGRYRDGRPDDHRVGYARTAGAVPARDAARRRRVVPAVLRAGRGLRPRRPAHTRRARRRANGLSTARRCGRRARTTATGACCSPAATPTRRSTRASPRSCSTCARPGIDVRPLRQINGASHFNEVFLTDVRIPDSMRLGRARWRLARREHDAVERAGDDRRRRARRFPRSRRARAALRRRPAIRCCARSSRRATRVRSSSSGSGCAARSRKDQGLGPGGVGAEARGVAPARARRQPRDGAAGRAVDALRRRRDPARLLAAAVPRPVEQPDRRRHRADPAQRDRRAGARAAERTAARARTRRSAICPR